MAWRTPTRVLVAVGMVCALLAPVAPGRAWAAEPESGDVVYNRAEAAHAARHGGPAVSAAARAALLGSSADLQRFLDEGWGSALTQDDRVRVGELMAADGPTVADAANAALDGSHEDVRKFLDEGFDKAWLHDERIRVGEAIAAGGPVTVERGNQALDAGDDAVAEFLSAGLKSAQMHDDRIEVGMIINAGGPAVQAAGKRGVGRHDRGHPRVSAVRAACGAGA